MLDRHLVEEVAGDLRTSPGLIEKDWQVVHAIGVLATIDQAKASLTFSGGTSLQKGWGLIRRFSEDIDFKILMAPTANATKDRTQRSAYRKRVLETLATGSFEPIGDPAIGNESRFFSADFAYPTQFKTGPGLRPHIQVQMFFAAPALPPVARPIRSLIAEAKGDQPEVAAFACIDPVETAADKLSALAWRVCTRQRGEKGDDPAVIRHLHDLAALADRVAEAASFATLVHQAAAADAGRGGAAVPLDLAARLTRMLERLRTDRLWAREYDDFVRQVSFAEPGEQIGFDQALAAVDRMTEQFLAA